MERDEDIWVGVGVREEVAWCVDLDAKLFVDLSVECFLAGLPAFELAARELSQAAFVFFDFSLADEELAIVSKCRGVCDETCDDID